MSEEVPNNAETMLTELDNLDREMADLLGKRRALSRKLAAYKLSNDQAPMDYSQETRIMERMESACSENGAGREWGTKLGRLLADCTLEAHSRLMDRRTSAGQRKILIIGGLGKMGSWLADFVYHQGHDVLIYDPGGKHKDYANASSLEEGIKDAELIIVSVSLSRSPEVMRQLVALKPEGVVCDLCSIKKNLLPIYREALAARISLTSLHPLFGPGTRSLHGQNIVVCTCGDTRADAAICALFSETAANLVTMTPEEHDHLMGLTLSMSHAVNMLFARAVAHSGEKFERLNAVASATWNKQMKTTCEVAGENMDLYFEIQRQCDFRRIYESMEKEAATLKTLLGEDRRSEFKKEMEVVADYFEPNR